MSYLKFSFVVEPAEPWTEILIAMLEELPFETFEQTNSGFDAFIKATLYKNGTIEEAISSLEGNFSYSYSSLELEDKNWNEIWESSFEPVIVNEKCCIRADFHLPEKRYEYEIVINPKMSFGTGHHETTQLMIERMLNTNFKGQIVADAGCGTAVLAVLAEMKGAEKVLAYDIDSWAVENSLENVALNSCSKIEVIEGNASLLQGKLFNVILANINKNILKSDMKLYATSLMEGGSLLLSGFFVSDMEELQSIASLNKLSFVETYNMNDWCLLHLKKKV